MFRLKNLVILGVVFAAVWSGAALLKARQSIDDFARWRKEHPSYSNPLIQSEIEKAEPGTFHALMNAFRNPFASVTRVPYSKQGEVFAYWFVAERNDSGEWRIRFLR